MIFQQDCTPPHFCTEVCAYPDGMFLGKWIECVEPAPWPPDLTCIDFRLYVPPVSVVLYEVQQHITAAVKEVAQDMLCLICEQ